MASGSAKDVLKTVKAKTPEDLVDKTVTMLSTIDAKTPQKTQDSIAKYLTAMKDLLYGTGVAEAHAAEIVSQIANAAYSKDMLNMIVDRITCLGFEAKKDCVAIFTKLLRREYGSRSPTAEHICAKPEILEKLVKGYAEEFTQVDALNSGLMLRECIKKDTLAKIILNDDALFGLFFDYVQKPTFDIAADAFSTFKDLLSVHKIICANFLEANYEGVFTRYNSLLKSDNYVTKRQSLKLLGELLLDRANFSIMTKFIDDPSNLKIMMNMLRDPSKNIQFEAFHVFKVFVANPNKSSKIMGILLRNQSALVTFLEKFHQSREEDEQFADEKQYLIKQIRDLK